MGEPVRLLAMKSDFQHENIKRLQAAVQTAFSAAARRPQQGALTHAVEVGGRRRCRETHDMDVVLEALKGARKGQGHPFTASFVEARKLYCTRRDSELPFTITKQHNSFAVCKVYLVRLDQWCAVTSARGANCCCGVFVALFCSHPAAHITHHTTHIIVLIPLQPLAASGRLSFHHAVPMRWPPLDPEFAKAAG